jgi:hypothetical protein
MNPGNQNQQRISSRFKNNSNFDLDPNNPPQEPVEVNGDTGIFQIEGFGPSPAEIFAKQARAKLDSIKVPEDRARAEKNINRFENIKKDNDIRALPQKSNFLENPTEVPISNQIGRSFNSNFKSDSKTISPAVGAVFDFLMDAARSNKTPQSNISFDKRLNSPISNEPILTDDNSATFSPVEDLPQRPAPQSQGPILTDDNSAAFDMESFDDPRFKFVSPEAAGEMDERTVKRKNQLNQKGISALAGKKKLIAPTQENEDRRRKQEFINILKDIAIKIGPKDKALDGLYNWAARG